MSKYAKSAIQQQVLASAAGQKIERDVTEDAYERIKQLVEAKPTKNVDCRLNAEERYSMYYEILKRIRSGGSAEKIAMAVMTSINEHLEEKYKQSTGEIGPSGPVFRRADE